MAQRFVEVTPIGGPAANHEAGRLITQTERGPAPPGVWLVAFDIVDTSGLITRGGASSDEVFFVVAVDKESGEVSWHER